MVGKKATTDGSVITSHTCDGRYRTWMAVEPAADHPQGSLVKVYKGTAHTISPNDTTGLRLAGEIPQVAHTFAYLNTAYPCLNEKQLAIGETTFGGPDTLRNSKGMFLIEELERIALQRCTTARDAVLLIGSLVKTYGYGDGGECITIADPHEVWQMEILGEGPHRIGGVWAAQRIPDDHVAVSANIPRIGKLHRRDKANFLCSDNIEEVARKYNLWDGKGDFVFWKAFNASYANGRNFREREYFILNALAPSLRLSYDMEELPFSVKPDTNVDVRQVIALFRATYEGTDMDMCQNIKMPQKHKNADGTVYYDTVISPIANPWLTSTMMNTLNYIAPGTVDFKRTVSVAWCSYSFVAQLRHWLPDAVGGVCWMSVDNPAQSPRIPIFCGTTQLPATFAHCGQKGYDEQSLVWQFRRANKLATLAWQATKTQFRKAVVTQQEDAFRQVEAAERNFEQAAYPSAYLNRCTAEIYDRSVEAWRQLEADFWHRFAMGF